MSPGEVGEFSTEPSNPLAVDTSVAGSSGNFNVNESGLPQNALYQPFESSRVKLLRQNVVQLSSPRAYLLWCVLVGHFIAGFL